MIGFDAKRAFNNNTGLGNHARNLINALMRDYPENDYLLFTPKVHEEFLNTLQGDYKLYLPESGLPRLIHPLWRSFGIKKQLSAERIDIYHGLSNEIPFGLHGIKSVVTIHDLIFLKHSEQYPWIDRKFYALKTAYAARNATKIIAVSNETKRDLMEAYAVPEAKIEVIYPSVNPVYQLLKPLQQKPPVKYILNVASFYPRKNQAKLVEAYAAVEGEIEEELWLIGKDGNMIADIRQLIAEKKLAHRIKLFTGVSDAELPGIYQGASVFVYPSLFEGFGMPVVEALFCNTPVITTRGGAMEEAAGPGSLLVNPRSTEDIADKILKVLKDGDLKRSMIIEGYKHALTMTDKVAAEITMKIYERLV